MSPITRYAVKTYSGRLLRRNRLPWFAPSVITGRVLYTRVRVLMERIEAGRAHCALCGEVIRPGEDAFITPDFLADEADPFWRFADAPMHRPCFLVWDRRKAFIARYNRAARQLAAPDGSYPRMTSDGDIVGESRS